MAMAPRAFFAALALCMLARGDAHGGHSHSSSAHAYAPAPSTAVTNPLAAILDAPELSTTSRAIVTAGVEGSYAIPGANYTILAPSDAAWRALSVDFLTSPRLGGILAFHTIPGVFKAADLKNGTVVKTVWGLELEVVVSGSSVTFVGGRNNATVTQADVPAGQSIIHVVNNVLDRRSNLATASAPAMATLARVNDSHAHSPNPLAPGGAAAETAVTPAAVSSVAG